MVLIRKRIVGLGNVVCLFFVLFLNIVGSIELVELFVPSFVH